MVPVGVADEQVDLGVPGLAVGRQLLAELPDAGAGVDDDAGPGGRAHLHARGVAAVALGLGAGHRKRPAHAPETDPHGLARRTHAEVAPPPSTHAGARTRNHAGRITRRPRRPRIAPGQPRLRSGGKGQGLTRLELVGCCRPGCAAAPPRAWRASPRARRGLRRAPARARRVSPPGATSFETRGRPGRSTGEAPVSSEETSAP